MYKKWQDHLQSVPSERIALYAIIMGCVIVFVAGEIFL
tara:strand:- start:434 stop:547 length:114 start_codon:yes stop_codon:yes gene_type:complete